MGQLLANLLHEQQIERGASAVFLGSSGQKFGEEMKAQRKITEESVRSFWQLFHRISVLERQSGALKSQARSRRIPGGSGSNDGVRAKIDAQELTTAEAVAYYTNLNAETIRLVKSMSKLSIDPEITAAIISLQAS